MKLVCLWSIGSALATPELAVHGDMKTFIVGIVPYEHDVLMPPDPSGQGLADARLKLELTAGDASGSYRFSCPHCGVVQRKPASHRVVSILLATGVSYEIVPAFGQITEEEIAAFANALDQDGWYSELPRP